MRRPATYRLRRLSKNLMRARTTLSRAEKPSSQAEVSGSSTVSGCICMKSTQSPCAVEYWTTLLGCSLGVLLSLLGSIAACVLLADMTESVRTDLTNWFQSAPVCWQRPGHTLPPYQDWLHSPHYVTRHSTGTGHVHTAALVPSPRTGMLPSVMHLLGYMLSRYCISFIHGSVDVDACFVMHLLRRMCGMSHLQLSLHTSACWTWRLTSFGIFFVKKYSVTKRFWTKSLKSFVSPSNKCISFLKDWPLELTGIGQKKRNFIYEFWEDFGFFRKWQ